MAPDPDSRRGGADSSEKVLRFSAITRRARNEVRLLTTQRTLVDGFIRQAIQTTQHEEELARTLFELLLPNEFKDASLDEDNIVLMVDEESAAYPWELLEDPLEGRGPDDRQPFSCRRGVLRQLESLEYRDNIQPSTSKEALVVGDPVSPFVELKGAQAGGRAVARDARCQRAVPRDSSGSAQRHAGAEGAVRPALSRAASRRSRRLSICACSQTPRIGSPAW